MFQAFRRRSLQKVLGFRADYYVGDQIAAGFNTANWRTTSVLANCNYTNAMGRPPGIASGDWTVSYSALVIAEYSQTYTFYLDVEGKANLWINGAVLIPTVGTIAELTGNVSLTAGQSVAIAMNFYDDDIPNSVYELLWSGPSLPKERISSPKAFTYINP